VFVFYNDYRNIIQTRWTEYRLSNTLYEGGPSKSFQTTSKQSNQASKSNRSKLAQVKHTIANVKAKANSLKQPAATHHHTTKRTGCYKLTRQSKLYQL
jgi:hypothetical protein